MLFFLSFFSLVGVHHLRSFHCFQILFVQFLLKYSVGFARFFWFLIPSFYLHLSSLSFRGFFLSFLSRFVLFLFTFLPSFSLSHFCYFGIPSSLPISRTIVEYSLFYADVSSLESRDVGCMKCIFSPSISLSPSLFLSFFCVCMCVCKQFSFEFAHSSNPYTVCHDCLFYPYEPSCHLFFSLARSLIYSFFFSVFCARFWFFFSNLNIRSAFFFLPLHSDLYPSFRILHI